MNQDKIIPLKVFNASAGSGKTYQLVKEYIKLLISDEAPDHQFSHILAMTFTNKAALEMKQRIVSALDEICNTTNKADLVEQLSKESNVKKAEIVDRCKRILTQILHRYEDFHVMTIDKFNLRLIKSFSRDLDLPAEFEVVMNEVEMIEKIVDDLLGRLGTEGADNLNKLIISYAKNNVDEGDRWNFRSNLISFGQILNKEQNKDIVDQLLLMDFSMEKYNNLHAQKKVQDTEFNSLTGKLREVLELNPLNSDLLPGKSTTYNAIIKLSEYETFQDSDKLVSDSFIGNLDKELNSKQLYPEDVKSRIRSIISYWNDHKEDYHLMNLFLRNFFNMALLQYIAGEIKNVRKEEQMIRISEFNTLISELIRKESALYIYERLGTKFHHFLLDEFQDTSRLQWLNLVPLVRDSLANQRMNLIVGDPKQSIYRFKNGVAEQFVALPGVYNPENNKEIAEHSAYFRNMGEVHALDHNWRSAKNIVEFNNTFFDRMKTFLYGETASFYNSIHQEPMSDRTGRIKILSKEDKITTDETVDHIQECIEECRKDGFQMNDICILGNRNRDCNAWAIELTKRGYKVVSSDSLLIQSDLYVQLTIAYMNWRLHPHGQNEMKRFAELFFRLKDDATVSDYLAYITEEPGKKDPTKMIRRFDGELFISDHFNDKDEFFSSFEGLYDLIEHFYRIASLKEMSNPYLHHLADIAFEFGNKKGPDLKLFLDEYERTKGNIAVQVPESSEAIQVMTMHKSKGLEFPVVIIPSLNFSMDIKGSFLVDIEDFIIYKKPKQNESIEVLKELYDHEKEQVLVDCVNLCYVAMTRPEQRLYIYNHFEKKNFGRLFHEALDVIDGIKTTEGVKYFDFKPDEEQITHEKEADSLLFHPTDLTEKLWFPDIALQDKEEVFDEDYLSPEMAFGRQFHLMISRINKAEEISSSIDIGIKSGEIDPENKEELLRKLNDTFHSEEYLAMFNDITGVLNEQSIIISVKETVRPDKVILKKNETVIIDYKTGIPNQKDQKQIKTYKSVLEEIGFPEVSGYLFYISDMRIEKIC